MQFPISRPISTMSAFAVNRVTPRMRPFGMREARKTVVIACFALLLGTVVSNGATPPSSLSFSLFATPDIVDWFNRNAWPDDGVVFTPRADMSVLDRLTRGKREMVYASAADAESQASSFAGRIDFIAYDIEHWPNTPADEQANPVAAVQRMRRLADSLAFRLNVAPDRRFALDWGTRMVPYADAFVLQVQRLQGDDAALQNFLHPLVENLRAANPRVILVAQISTEGGIDQMMHMATLLSPDVDRIAILYKPDSIPALEEFVARLRGGPVRRRSVGR